MKWDIHAIKYVTSKRLNNKNDIFLYCIFASYVKIKMHILIFTIFFITDTMVLVSSKKLNNKNNIFLYCIFASHLKIKMHILIFTIFFLL